MVKKSSLKPKRYHFYAALLFVLGTLFPPLAVAARFGIGSDFWLNLFLTLAGYIPGHAHNFYIQNIRNNKTHRRTPKWAQRYGLIDTSEIKRKERKSQWASRYDERNPHSALEGQQYEEGQTADAASDTYSQRGQGQGRRPRQANGADDADLWNPSDEQFYNERDNASVRTGASGPGRWHYPANFDDTIAEPDARPKKKKSDRRDRWERTADAYTMPEEPPRRKKSKKRRPETDMYSGQDGPSINDIPDDPEGGLYGSSRPRRDIPDQRDITQDSGNRRHTGASDDVFRHQF